MKAKIAASFVILFFSALLLLGQDPKAGAEAMKYSRDFYSKVHMVAIVKLTFENPPPAEFKYDRYPNGGAERIQSGDGEEYARKDGKTWLKSNDWGETGKPVDATTARRLNNWISVIDGQLNSQAPLKFVANRDAGEENETVFEQPTSGKGKPDVTVFAKYKKDQEQHPPLLSKISGPMKLGGHDAKIDISFSYLVAVQMEDVSEKTPPPAPSAAGPNANVQPTTKTSAPSTNNQAEGELIDRGIAKGRKGDLKGALADFDKAIKMEPNDSVAYYNRAYAKRLSKDFKGAVADYNRTIELDSVNADAFYNRGNVKAMNLKDLDGAIADYNRTIELNPQHSHAYYNRAIAKKMKGDKAGSDTDYKRAGEIDPELAPPTINTVTLLDGKFRIDIPSDFKREADDPEKPKTIAKFGRDDGAWGDVNRGTHGLTPDELDGYIKMRVAEYNKGFKWLPKDAHLQWLHKEIVTINGWKWADWSFVPMLKGKKDWRNSPVYSRNLTTSYKGQLLEVNFTTNLTTDPALKDEIDKIISSIHLEE